MDDEIWRDIPGYENKYQISNFGRVKSLPRKTKTNRVVSEKILKQEVHYKGYKAIRFYSSEKKGCIKFFIHRLVAISFIPNPEKKPIVNHKDGDKANNVIHNFEWVSESENTKHYYDFIKKRNSEAF
jgi:hypothetical protein